ncbi:tRNA-dihydrouridine(47) synthase [NAD(P)(+)] [Xylona heveae TC161]|uniref:tRNA-dihydrouridine(47) synthase [NAD(P)(+)] n=1 Tax=Xylona heveae (strain CBS 132557 / TC161) TaxID=1328760 RepID=A0A165GC94_XYLHT|nr:tRNA-dihydrouridine(47) synthase [NAD(P)(+)] [Xylona heveae TC161]KZF22018.1 tRNA-dihydrouridine(47) synthase [NAD(P)(+)] [Xylona heveae TC161]
MTAPETQISNEAQLNPLEPSSTIKRPLQEDANGSAQPIYAEDSAVTKAEKIERNGALPAQLGDNEFEESPAKRQKIEEPAPKERVKGVASIKSEYLVYPPGSKQFKEIKKINTDDKAESSGLDSRAEAEPANKKKKGKSKGQNTNRHFGSSRDALQLCTTRQFAPEFSPRECPFGDGCRFEHNLRKYLQEGKRDDLKTFDSVCPVWAARGFCNSGWKCRFVGSHSFEREIAGGRKELVLVEDEQRKTKGGNTDPFEAETGVVNVVSARQKIELTKRKVPTPKSDLYNPWLDKTTRESETTRPTEDTEGDNKEQGTEGQNGVETDDKKVEREENRARYTEPPLRPSEKRRLYFGPETPILAPLTTQGNLPFRRLCVDLGAQVTYSEMAMSLPLVQGSKSEWALMKAHESEATPPAFRGRGTVVTDYDNSKDLKFAAQIAANKPWQALKATEILTSLCPHLRFVDLNCGCPIDLVYRTGAGSALLDNHSKLEKILRGMNVVSGEVPVTVKIRMGTKDNRPTSQKLVERLVLGGHEANEMGIGPCGVAAITLHGRSRQQRYTKSADWSYISECAALIKRFQKERDSRADTVHEADPRDLSASQDGKIYFMGNGDCYSHVDYYNNLEQSKVDSIMIGRGALIKPWVFEEIEKGQYLDKSASERLEMVERFAKYGLEAWGSDEIGVGITRRFLLEWLSFAYRYVPIGILEHLPPSLQDRPPAFRGRSDLETLLASDNYKDWIKISEMFLGPAHKDFKFEPKHKSNSYEIEAEG